jgi:hypothetical protein
VDGRDITIDSCKLKAGKSWHYMLRDTSKPYQPAIKVYRTFFNTVSLPTKADATLAGEKLCRYLERLPARVIVRLSCRRKVFSVVTHARGNSGWFLYTRVMVSAHPVGGQSTRSRDSLSLGRFYFYKSATKDPPQSSCCRQIKDALISAAFSNLHNTKSREKSQISSHLNPISQWGRG